MGISIILLARKEATNLIKLLPMIKSIMNKIDEDYEIIVVDANPSLDNTKEVCKKNKVTYINQTNKGYANAFNSGVEISKYGKIVFLDCDFSHDPNSIIDINNKFNKGYDLIIGSRYIKGGKTLDSKTSRVLSKILGFIYRICLGLKVHDVSTSFRMYNAKQLKAVTLESTNFEVLEEVIFKMMQNKPKFKIGEVPITFNQRLFGTSNRRLLAFVFTYLKSLYNLIIIRYKSNDSFRNVVLYILIGLSAAIVDLLTFIMLYKVMMLGGIISNIISMHVGLLFSFIFNSSINFKKTNKIALRFSLYYVVIMCGIIVSTYIVYLFNNYAILGKLISLIIVPLCQFLLNRKLAFRYMK